uniref:Uncharacterized protein n=1 Tax=Zea mays TaxID=4577 RepID=C0P8Q4_MAIZE|nr:unknown [Zea mays]
MHCGEACRRRLNPSETARGETADAAVGRRGPAPPPAQGAHRPRHASRINKQHPPLNPNPPNPLLCCRIPTHSHRLQRPTQRHQQRHQQERDRRSHDEGRRRRHEVLLPSAEDARRRRHYQAHWRRLQEGGGAPPQEGRARHQRPPSPRY